MSTAKKSAAKPSKKKSASGSDAIALLTADHKEVKQLFKDYEELAESEADEEERQALAVQICTMLSVHATVEEEIFYPAAREAIDDEDLLDEATVEHMSAKELIAQIEAMSADEQLFDATVKVLGEYVDHHVQEEEGELFPKLKKSEIDLQALGQEITARKEELMETLEPAE